MDTRTIIILILVFVMVAAGLAFYGSERLRQGSTAHSYRYLVTVDSTGPVYNSTIIVPVGSVNGSSPIADAIEYGQMTGIPADWTLMLLTTDEAVFLKIQAPLINGSATVTPGPVDDTLGTADTIAVRRLPEVLEVSVDSDSPVDTASPAGTEPLLEPRTNLTPVPCAFPHPEGMAVSCFRYTVPVYARYESAQETVLSVRVELEGENTWWLWGWSGNSYSDSVQFSSCGPFSGWTRAEGASVFGLGRY